jgi:hypothetical protein
MESVSDKIRIERKTFFVQELLSENRAVYEIV